MDYEDSALTSPAVTVHRLPMVHTRLVWIVAFRSAKSRCFRGAKGDYPGP